MVKICIASSGLGHVTRGIESWAEDLGRSLHNRGQDVLLCKGSGVATESYEQVIPCWTRQSKSNNYLRRLVPSGVGWRIGLASPYDVEQSTFALRLIRLLRREQCDVLHLQDPQVAVLVQHALRMGLVGTRVVLNHGTEEDHEFQNRITYLQHGAPWHQQQAEEQGTWRDTWTMIPNFVDTETFYPGDGSEIRDELAIPSHGIVALVSSAIKSRHKRIDFLIEEFAALRIQRPELPIWFVFAGGREEETDALVDRAERQLGDRVRFAIQFPRNRMPELYRAADLLVHGSLKEMMPMTLLEASASGLPCLVNDHPVMAWMIGRGGKTLDLSARGNLTQMLAVLLTDSQERKRLGAAARNHCIEKFSEEVVVDQILEHYQRVIADQRMAA